MNSRTYARISSNLNLQESNLIAKDALAFSPKCGPKMNQAEVVHAGWANRDNRNLFLLDLAQIDVKDSLLLKAELKAIE